MGKIFGVRNAERMRSFKRRWLVQTDTSNNHQLH
jgi:hypothetical protein